MAPSLQNVFFRNQDWHSDDLGSQRTPYFRNKIAEMCYLYRRTGHVESTIGVPTILSRVTRFWSPGGAEIVWEETAAPFVACVFHFLSETKSYDTPLPNSSR